MYFSFGTSREKNVFKTLPVIASVCKARGDPLEHLDCVVADTPRNDDMGFFKFYAKKRSEKVSFFSAALVLRVSFVF